MFYYFRCYVVDQTETQRDLLVSKSSGEELELSDSRASNACGLSVDFPLMTSESKAFQRWVSRIIKFQASHSEREGFRMLLISHKRLGRMAVEFVGFDWSSGLTFLWQRPNSQSRPGRLSQSMSWEHPLAMSNIFKRSTYTSVLPLHTQLYTPLWQVGKGEHGQVDTQSKQKLPEQKPQAAGENERRLLSVERGFGGRAAACRVERHV